MKLAEIETPVETLPGVGPSTAKLFARLNIFTVGDLLTTYPKGYEDRTQRVSLRDFALHSKVHTVCKVTQHQWFGYGNMKTLKIAVTDGSANAWLIAFNRPFLQKSLPVGSLIAVTGKFEVKYNELQSTAFEAEKLDIPEQDIQSLNLLDITVPNSKVLPVYPLTEGLSQKHFQKAVTQALKQYGNAIDSEIPQAVKEQRKLLEKKDAVRMIHQPESLQEAENARKTLVYEELYNFEYKMSQRALSHRGFLPELVEFNEQKGPVLSPEQLQEEFNKSLSPKQKLLVARLPFELTQDQKKCILDMNTDVDKSQFETNTLLMDPGALESNPFSMQRLLQGDVGSGKTLVAFFVCLRVIDYGGQCAVLAPTELLARQHAENAAKLLEPLEVKVAFLTGNLKSKGRQTLVNALKDGNIDIVIGTHALFSQNVQYKKLALAVIDEQHRFGVAQRESIIAKGRISAGKLAHSPDVLLMSATPIPQTLALTLFGDLDTSTIKTLPAGRKETKTYLSVMGHESNVYEAVRKELNAGHQAYFVYPRISEGASGNQDDEDSFLKSAEQMFDFLSNQVYPGIPCALIHSQVEEEQQNQILQDFRNGTIKVLVATTVVEVGVDVANANCIVIEHADRFGLAELHQLRGRVGRSSLQSYCFLIYGKNISETGKARLKALHDTTDGFEIAEQDLKLRGPGEVLGTAQSGNFALGIADINRDRDLLQQARYDVYNQIKLHKPQA